MLPSYSWYPCLFISILVRLQGGTAFSVTQPLLRVIDKTVSLGVTRLKIQDAAALSEQNCKIKTRQSSLLSLLPITKCWKGFQTKTILNHYSSLHLPIFTSIQTTHVSGFEIRLSRQCCLSSGQLSKTPASLLLPMLSCLLTPPPLPIKRMVKDPPFLILFLSNTSPFLSLHFLHDYRTKEVYKKNSD